MTMLIWNWSIKIRLQHNFEVFYGLIQINYLRSLLIDGEHIYARFLIVSCNNVVAESERDPELLDKMLKEKDIVASVVVKDLQNAIKRGYKFTESERTKKNREEYAIKNNSLALFVKECCIKGTGKPEERTKISDFKEIYKNWCRKNDLEPEKSNSITDILVNELGIVKGKSYHDYYELIIKPMWEVGGFGE